MNPQPIVAVLPSPQIEYIQAVALGGGIASDLGPKSTGLVWTDSQGCAALSEVLEGHPGIAWVQLPFAGVDNFKPLFDRMISSGRDIRFTSAKGAYREPVAEHALTLALALARALPARIAAKTWGRKFADTLFDSEVLIVGGGGIAHELIRLLTPFRAKVTVFRRSEVAISGARVVSSISGLDSSIATADFIFIAAALTAETEGLFDARRLSMMKARGYLVNVARGAIVDSLALERALINGDLAGAGIDVTDPEPLPDGHSLWSAPNLIITPHTADTPEMCIKLLAERIVKNVRALSSGEPLEGTVNLKLGY